MARSTASPLVTPISAATVSGTHTPGSSPVETGVVPGAGTSDVLASPREYTTAVASCCPSDVRMTGVGFRGSVYGNNGDADTCGVAHAGRSSMNFVI